MKIFVDKLSPLAEIVYCHPRMLKKYFEIDTIPKNYVSLILCANFMVLGQIVPQI